MNFINRILLYLYELFFGRIINVFKPKSGRSTTNLQQKVGNYGGATNRDGMAGVSSKNFLERIAHRVKNFFSPNDQKMVHDIGKMMNNLGAKYIEEEQKFVAKSSSKEFSKTINKGQNR